VAVGVLALLAIASLLNGATDVAIGLGALALSLVLRLVYECGAAAATVTRALRRPATVPAPDTAGFVETAEIHQARTLGFEL
jgi:hypothetical protein